MTRDEILEKIEEKYKQQEQPMDAYLQGLLHAKSINYWDYIQVDALFSLQKTRTDFPDEVTFLMYHQVTELLLKLVTHELEQATVAEGITGAVLLEKIKRAQRYTEVAQMSFDVMREGMDPKQYDQFRHTLTPASGFQSATFREIEFFCTDLWNLVYSHKKEEMKGSQNIDELFNWIYWQAAGIDRKTGKKSLTLQQFEEKYLVGFKKLATTYQTRNLWQQFVSLPEEEKTEELIALMKGFDQTFNVRWPLVHLRTAEHYLEHGQEVKAATGGSDWKKYLHPKFQRRMFFPELLSQEELDNWGEV
ncbi:MAG: tryptophan 2,3-dioxygenase family protein [Flavobacteriales bacterium]